MRTGYAALSATGAVLTAAAIIGLLSPIEDAAMAALVTWIRPTNAYYDALRIELSLVVLGLFLIWAGFALQRSFPPPARPPHFVWRPEFVAGLGIFPIFWIGHHELLGMPDWIWAEDGPMEYLTVTLLAASAGFTLIARRRGGDRFDGAERALLLIFAVGLLVLAAEEISWGQRLLDIETPAALKQKNVQGEINLHNLTVGWNEVFRMAVACALSALILLNETDSIPGLRGRLDGLKPAAGRFFWLPLLLIPAHLYDELFEQVASFAILAYAMGLAARARHS